MTARLQPDDLTRQLRSLSIVREPQGVSNDSAPSVRAKPKWPWALLVGLACLAFALWTEREWITAIWSSKSIEPLVEMQPKVETVTPLPAQPTAPITGAGLVGSGYVVAGRQSVVGTDVGGRLADLPVATGERVVAGQILARLDDSAARLNLSLAEGELAIAKADLDRLQILRDQAAAKATRQAALSARGAAPTADSEDATFALQLAEADIALARQSVTQRQIMAAQASEALQRQTITAPFDGLIVETHAVVGDLIGSALDGGPALGLLLLIDSNSLRVEADFAETALTAITIGQKAEVELDAWPGKRIPAHVEAILPRASLQKGTITLRLKLEDPALTPLTNMAAKVTLLATP